MRLRRFINQAKTRPWRQACAEVALGGIFEYVNKRTLLTIPVVFLLGIDRSLVLPFPSQGLGRPSSPSSGSTIPTRAAAGGLVRPRRKETAARSTQLCCTKFDGAHAHAVHLRSLASTDAGVSAFFCLLLPRNRWPRWRLRWRGIFDSSEGKGLSKDEKVQKLALQHWLEAKEKKFYEVIIENRKLLYKLIIKIVNTSEGSNDSKWIFVLSSTRALYIGAAVTDEIYILAEEQGHISALHFLAGGSTSAAGRLIVDNGILKAVWPHIGHYRPTEANFWEFMSYLKKTNVDHANVKLSPSEGEDDEWIRLRSSHTQFDRTDAGKPEKEEDASRADEDNAIAAPAAPPSTSGEADTAAGTLVMKRHAEAGAEQEPAGQGRGGAGRRRVRGLPGLLQGVKENLFWGGEEGEEMVVVPQEKILYRLNSRMAMNSYQLGKQLSFRRTTGAGPRIGCVRDYPPELQFQALEQVSLSPRGGAGPARLGSTPRQGSCAVRSARVTGAAVRHDRDSNVESAARCSLESARDDGVARE
ncbi:hypothetical protein ABZP36_020333 [Zizania latifolia]